MSDKSERWAWQRIRELERLVRQLRQEVYRQRRRVEVRDQRLKRR